MSRVKNLTDRYHAKSSRYLDYFTIKTIIFLYYNFFLILCLTLRNLERHHCSCAALIHLCQVFKPLNPERIGAISFTNIGKNAMSNLMRNVSQIAKK